MEKMKSLADQLREKMVKTGEKQLTGPAAEIADPPKKTGKKAEKAIESDLLQALYDYDNSHNKSMVHVRLEKSTVDVLNRFKMATGIDVTKIVAFSVKHLFDTYPELKNTIKQFIQNTEL
ncbi:hypothetical protein KHS38_14175 [Mucilaginibacter sp. Bleaf8]|uniref:hypothetical protein n=1 Tax=Mucilaginibacter sp. Bleaf8 TaxID=2834430 RepID=UPI001BCB707B|nr:hypothetical protein [Mucilaginibacter sp. Bleaf8]MBS7565556.1 hypothetical protein [Mucilaginibacter sp. Bleaf8]